MHHSPLLTVFTAGLTIVSSVNILTDRCDVYVDKSLLLKHVMDHDVSLVTAPRKFMKTTNLKFIKSFLSLKVTEAGGIEESSTEYFEKLDIYTKEKQLFDEHFAQYPVVHLDLRCEEWVTKYGDAREILRRKIHECFSEHRYLQHSTKLREREKEMVRKWCDSVEYKKMNDQLFRHGLEKLTHFLYSHFQKKVYVLVDDYDSIITQAMYGVLDDQEFEGVLDLVCDQIAMVFQTNDCIKGGFITGVTHIAESHFSKIPNAALFKFLDLHKLKEFFGFTEDDVQALFHHPKFSLSGKIQEDAKKWYGGYKCSLNSTMYNPFSILNFLKSGRVESYWAQTASLNQFTKLMRNHEIRNEIENILTGNVTWIQYQFHFDLKDLLIIRDSYLGTKEISSNYHVIFSNFLELGYLSYLPGPLRENSVGVKIPNREIGEYIVEKCKEYYIQVCKVDKHDLDKVDFSNFGQWLTKFYKGW